MKKSQLIDKCMELLEEEHGGCDDNTCTIRRETAEVGPYHVLECFYGCGAASPRFERVFKALTAKYKTPFKVNMRDAGRICREFPHQTCESCNAVVWDFYSDYSEGDTVHCDSCASTLIWKPEEDKK